MDDIRLGNTLRVLRIRKHLRQSDVARRARTRRQVVSKVESGLAGRYPLDTIRGIAHALGARLDSRLRFQGADLDRIINAGGYISARTGAAPDGNAVLVPKPDSDSAMDAASCIGCGACVAACPNASAALFTAAKISHFAHLPQGAPERKERVLRMVAQMDEEDFGSCSNHGECEAVCPKKISISNIALMRREFIKAKLS